MEELIIIRKYCVWYSLKLPLKLGACRSRMPNLRRRNWNWVRPRAFVNMTVSWSVVGTWIVIKSPNWIRSRTKWQSISICLVRSWKTGLAEMWRADWLSQRSSIGWPRWTPKDVRRLRSQTSSLVVIAMARYSASAEERETVVCFFVFQEIGHPPTMTK